MAKNYSSIYNIKDFLNKDLVPKYFDTDDVNEYNLGLLGYTTEMVSTVTEDTYNTISAYMNEIFPNLAIMPESIYNYGALFQLTGGIATPSRCVVYLFVSESDVIKYGTTTSSASQTWHFYLDSDMTIDVEGVQFKPDYTIHIARKILNGKNVYTVSYDKTKYGGPYTNSFSDITNTYIKSRVITYEGERFIQMEVSVHQVDKFYINENVINSDVINLPTYTIDFDGYLSGFEVFYRESESTKFTQLKKLLLGSAGLKDEKFCYYKIIDDSRVEISFSSRDGYFYPRYNSEINIEYYTTLGKAGNFDIYTGTNITVYPSSTTYDYNKNLLLYGIPMTGATGGTDPLTSADLKNMSIEKFSTANSYTNSNDLELYFKNLNESFESQIYFVKKRDDIFERVFSAFSLMKDDTSNIYNTNTSNIKLKFGFNGSPTDFDDESSTTLKILKPGKKFIYESAESLDTLVPAPDGLVTDDFVYINPFLIVCPNNPLSVGYYLNSVNSKHIMTYADSTDINEESLVQFISGSLSIYRNAISSTDSNKYRLSVTVVPTMELPYPMVITSFSETPEFTNPYYNSASGTVTLQNGTVLPVEYHDGVLITNAIKISLYVYSDLSATTIAGYRNMKFDLASSDIQNSGYTFYTDLETDDAIVIGNDVDKISIRNLLDKDPNASDTWSEIESILVPMSELTVAVKTYYINADNSYTWTNKYATLSNKVTLSQPLDIVHGTVYYTVDAVDADHNVIDSSMMLSSVPVIGLPIIYNDRSVAGQIDTTDFMNFIDILNQQYANLTNVSKLTTNNYSIDLKLYNTFGKSKNFVVNKTASDTEPLDRVNITIRFDIKFVFGADTEALLTELKSFIKSYIEDINSGGMNSIYISNLIKEIENNFSQVQYIIFRGINDYPTDVQGIENKTTDLSTLTREQQLNYIPEYLTVALDNVIINVL